MFYYRTADDAINTEIAAEPDSTSQVEVESGDSTPTAEPKSTVPNGIETASVSSHTSAPTGTQTRIVVYNWFDDDFHNCIIVTTLKLGFTLTFF